MSKHVLPEETLPDKVVRGRMLISFILFIVLIASVWATIKWINRQPKVAGTLKPLRKTLNFNENIFSAVFDSGDLIKEYPVSAAAKRVRVNGIEGLRDSVSAETWRLKVIRAPGDTLQLSLEDIRHLPKKDLVFDFKCIEGWSQKIWCGEVTFEDFVKHHGLQSDASKT
jgi:DMSO/TMAO reductase YedYZ molybdopterin-dependent catalytic subunit